MYISAEFLQKLAMFRYCLLKVEVIASLAHCVCLQNNDIEMVCQKYKSD